MTSPTKSRIPSTPSGNTGLVGFSKISVRSRGQCFSSATCLLATAMEIGPQPHGVVRSNIYTAMKSGVQHMLDWVRFFNSGATDDWRDTSVLPQHTIISLFSPPSPPAGTIFEGGCVDVFTMVKHIDYPRDRETGNIIAAVHPHLQVWLDYLKGAELHNSTFAHV